MSPSKIVITGGCGFLGHHVVEHFLKRTQAKIVVLDKLEHDSALNRLRDIECFREDRVLTLACNLNAPIEKGVQHEIWDCDVFLHIAAESHVDNSIRNPGPFVMNNVCSTLNCLDWVRGRRVIAPSKNPLFVYFSTDEVFGPAPDGMEFKEDAVHSPKNPYAASKSASEQIVTSFCNTYKVRSMITRCMNIFGERQHPSKFIPLAINAILDQRELQIHADSTCTKAGSRFYIHARNVADALEFLIGKAQGSVTTNAGTWHIRGELEVDNLTMARMIADIIGKPLVHRLVDFHSSRPGHDLRYAMSGEKLANAGWTVPVHFEQSLHKTVTWFLANPQWLKE